MSGAGMTGEQLACGSFAVGPGEERMLRGASGSVQCRTM